MAKKHQKQNNAVNPQQQETEQPVASEATQDQGQATQGLAEQVAENPALAKMRERAAQMASKATGKQPKDCACGCGGQTKGGTWLPGHDAKALSRELQAARAAAKATEQPAEVAA